MKTNCCFISTGPISELHAYQMDLYMTGVLDDLAKREPFTFYTGGDEGFDLNAAAAVLDRREADPRIKLRLAIAYPGQGWDFRGESRFLYRSVEQRADHVALLTGRYFPGCIEQQQRWLVDHCGVCVYFSQSRSSSSYMLEYARAQGRELIDAAAYLGVLE